MVQQLSVPLVSFGGQLFSHGSTPSSSPDFLIQDFAVIMIVAAIMLVITHRLKQPMVIGYILAGMIIGYNFLIYVLTIHFTGIKGRIYYSWFPFGVVRILALMCYS
jgi:hypothetical protein